MSQLFVAAVRWLFRHLLSLILILAVLLCGKWLHVKWEEAGLATEQLNQLQSARPVIGNELLKAAQEIEQQLRLGVSSMPGVEKLQINIAASTAAKRAERDRLKREFPLAINIPVTEEFRRMTVLNMELSMLAQADARASQLTTLMSDVAAGKGQIDTLRRSKAQAEQAAYQNKLEQWQIRQAHPVASAVPFSWPGKRLSVLAAELPGLQAQISNAQVRIDSLTFTVSLTEKRLDEARAIFMRGHGGIDQAIAAIDARIEQKRRELGDGFWPELKQQLPLAGSILLSIILLPVGLKLLFYYVLAPWASRQQPIRILDDGSGEPGNVRPVARIAAAGVSLTLVIEPEQELLVHSDFLQSTSANSTKSTAWVLDPAYLFTSLAAGMYALTRILPYQSEPTTISSSADAAVEVASIELQEGAAIVFHPRYLVGVVQKRDQPLRIASHWRPGHLQSWLTLQLRYLVFHGPATLIVKGCRGVALEPAGSGRLINQAATLGFSVDVAYSVTRCETFISYWRGQEELFNDKFAGDSGIYIYEEMPSHHRKSGITGRGLEGLADSMLKIFGV